MTHDETLGEHRQSPSGDDDTTAGDARPARDAERGDTARKLGLGTAVGLAGAAAAGLLASGHHGTGPAGGHPAPTATPGAGPVPSGGQGGPSTADGGSPAVNPSPAGVDQTGTVTAQATPEMHATHGPVGSGGVPTLGTSPTGTGYPPQPGFPGGQGGSPGMSVPDGRPLQAGGATTAGPPPGVLVGGSPAGSSLGKFATAVPPFSDGGTPAAASSPQDLTGATVYDRSGHPIGTVGKGGEFVPLTGTASGAHGQGAQTPPVLFDSAGHPIALTDGTGHVVPLSALIGPKPMNGTGGRRMNGPTTGQGPGAHGQSATPTGGGQQGQTSSGGQAQEVMSDPQIAAYMRGLSAQQREKVIEDVLQRNGIRYSGSLPALPADFYDKDTYSFAYASIGADGSVQYARTRQLNSLEAAATAAMLKSESMQLKVDIGALSATAINLENGPDLVALASPLFDALNNVDSIWGSLFADANDSNDPNLTKARFNFATARSELIGGPVNIDTGTSCVSTDVAGNIAAVAAGIGAVAKSLHEMASLWVEVENDNLSQFGMKADDPRPAWERGRYVNGQDVTDGGNFPTGFFDPTNPQSPYYDPSYRPASGR